MKKTEQQASAGVRPWVRDAVLIGVLLLLGVSAFFVLKACEAPGSTVCVRVGGVTVAEYPLDTDGVYVLNGGTNTLVIEGGAAYVRDCDCPDKLCENIGKIRYGGQSITCLPNRVQINVRADGGVDVAQ